jgi:hypothetical protein
MSLMSRKGESALARIVCGINVGAMGYERSADCRFLERHKDPSSRQSLFQNQTYGMLVFDHLKSDC